jgi:predicted DNA-binding ribbon-helix-helix protein
MAKEIVIKEKELNINIIIVAKKNGSKNDSNLRFFLRLCVASNLVIKICEEQAKITLNEKIFVK